MYVHYLLALKGSPWELRHVSVALPVRRPSLPESRGPLISHLAFRA